MRVFRIAHLAQHELDRLQLFQGGFPARFFLRQGRGVFLLPLGRYRPAQSVQLWSHERPVTALPRHCRSYRRTAAITDCGPFRVSSFQVVRQEHSVGCPGSGPPTTTNSSRCRHLAFRQRPRLPGAQAASARCETLPSSDIARAFSRRTSGHAWPGGRRTVEVSPHVTTIRRAAPCAARQNRRRRDATDRTRRTPAPRRCRRPMRAGSCHG
jgi:hypothetical protein